MQKLSDFVFDYLAGAGVNHVFMLPGGGCMHLVDSLGKHPAIEYTVNLHEQACAVAAEAYAQYTNDIGVALVTTGPGATNAITGVASAWLDSIPVLILSGQVKRDDLIGNRKVRQMGFQEINIVDMVKPITKYAVTITDPESVKYHLQKALYLARSGRPGPAWLDIPLDVQDARIEETKLKCYSEEEQIEKVDIVLLKEQVARTIELLNNAERPVILAGNGIRLAKAEHLFLDLVKKLQVPVLTTWKTIDFFDENDEWYFGRPGSVGQRGANFVQQNADSIMIIGARLDFGQTGYNHKNFAREARKIMVDADMHEINKMMTLIDVPVCADAGLFIEELQKNIALVENKDRNYWIGRCKEWKARYPVVLPEYKEQKDFVNDYYLIDLLSDELTADDVIIPGSSGACSERTMQAFRIKKGMRLFNSEGLGPMGFGLPAAIGGCLASEKKRTVCIDGDGGFVMNIQELETLKRLELPVKIFVLNNKGYGSIRITQKAYFEGRFAGSSTGSGLTLPDFCRVADAHGIRTFRIANNPELKENIRQILDYNGPVLCELLINPDQVTAPRMMSYKTEDGRMISRPLEDLWPFLDRDEFRQNMIIKPLEDK
ncbi:MAG TPA: thiamine pyrophosphate-binding protein [Bacteroidales bacterium]|nr:thiamine pyrophosphate-binding protein [Bacteroidales bacterium]